MMPSHLSWLLVSTVLLLVRYHVSANPAKYVPKEPTVKGTDTCPRQMHVGMRYSPTRVPLHDTLEFSLKPNMAEMSMTILGHNTLYTATVEGTMIILRQCDVQGSNCVTLEEAGSKGSDLLVPNEWNRIRVKYNNGQVTVDVNMKTNVMGGAMRMTNRQGIGGEVTVIFLAPATEPSYAALLEIPCPEVTPWTPPTPRLTDAPISTAATTSKPSLPVRPFEGCPLYQVENDHPSMPASVHDRFTMAVYPSHPALHLIVRNDNHHPVLKVHVDGSRAELLQCEVRSRQCSSKDERVIDEFFIAPGKWNFVTFYLLEDKIKIEINERKEALMGSLQSAYRKGLDVIAMAPQKQSVNVKGHFVAFVNVQCEGGEHITWATNPTTPSERGLPTNAPIVETTTEPPAPGISRNVGIIVGVLVGVLLIIALAVVISTMKKRRSAGINEQSPLQNQYQQQD